jgi:hypothetical protein
MECFRITLQALTLAIRGMWAAYIRSFGPLQPEPTKVFQLSLSENRARSALVQIVIAKNQCATFLLGPAMGNPEGSGVAEMQKAGGRRG